MEFVKLQIEEEIAVVTIDRPKSMNALNNQVYEEIIAHLEAIQANDQVKVVILTGAGEKAFAAGADIAQMVHQDAMEGRHLGGLAVLSALHVLLHEHQAGGQLVDGGGLSLHVGGAGRGVIGQLAAACAGLVKLVLHVADVFAGFGQIDNGHVVFLLTYSAGADVRAWRRRPRWCRWSFRLLRAALRPGWCSPAACGGNRPQRAQ